MERGRFQPFKQSVCAWWTRQRGRSRSLRAGAATVVLALALAVPATHAVPVDLQSAPPPPEANAATAYARAHAAINSEGIYSDEDQILISDLVSGALPERQRRQMLEQVRLILGRLQPTFESVAAAAALPECDWQLDKSQGLSLLMPHLESQRTLSKLLTARSLVAVEDGDIDLFLQGQREGMELSRHSSQDGVLISGLLGMASAGFMMRGADALLASGAADPASAAELAELYRSMSGADTFRLGDAMEAEGDLMLASLRTQQQREALASAEQDGTKPFDMLDDLDEQEAERQLGELDGLYKRAAEVLRIDDPAEAKAAMEKLTAEVEASGNAFAQALFPSVGNALKSRDRLRSQLLEKAGAFDEIAKGRDAAAAEHANAAYWYRRAAQGVFSLPLDAQTASVLVLAATETLDEDARRRVLDMQLRSDRAIGASLRRAGAIPQCSFAQTHRAFDVELMGAMRGAIRLQLAAALIGATDRIAGDIAPRREAAVSAVTMAIRAVRHLSLSPSALHALTALSILEDAAGAVEAMQRVSPSLLDGASTEFLQAELARLDARDPCGFDRAQRAEVEFLFGGWAPSGADPAIREGRIRRALELTLDHTLFLRSAWSEGLPVPEVDEDLARWDDLLPPARVEEARAMRECLTSSALAGSDAATVNGAPVLGTCEPIVVVDMAAASRRPAAALERLARCTPP